MNDISHQTVRNDTDAAIGAGLALARPNLLSPDKGRFFTQVVPAGATVKVHDLDALREPLAEHPRRTIELYSDSWWEIRSAAYKAARAYYDANPLPITQEIAELAASQQDAALELLEALIDPEQVPA